MGEEHGIGWAVEMLQVGSAVRRRGWNGKGMSLHLRRSGFRSEMTLPYVYLYTAQRETVPWLCSQTDLLATDWELA